MQKKRRSYNQLMRFIFQCILFLSLFFIFFGILSISNPQLFYLSRTAVTTMIVFIVCLFVLTTIYGSFDIGRKTKRVLLINQALTIFFTDISTYLFLQVMNVNPNNPEANETLILFGEDFLLLLAAFFLQISITILLLFLGDFFYFRANPPKSCLLVTSSQETANHVAEKILSFRQRFRLEEVVHYTCPDLIETLQKYDTVFIAGIPDTEEVQLESICYSENKSMYLLAELENVLTASAENEVLEDTLFLHIRPTGMTPMQRFVKRGLDIFISLLGLFITSPILLITAILIKCTDNGPVFFRQKRLTLNGDVFEILKFRTMYADAADQADILSAQKDDPRVTPLGKYLRKFRIDELPQLVNVLKGKMSIVGPRPEMLENVNRYTEEVPEFRYRQRMKAGLTGLAQIDGKYNTSPKDKAMLDLYYIENFSLSMDFKLMLRTFTVFFRKDSTEGFGTTAFHYPVMRTDAFSESPRISPDETNISRRRKKKRQKRVPVHNPVQNA